MRVRAQRTKLVEEAGVDNVAGRIMEIHRIGVPIFKSNHFISLEWKQRRPATKPFCGFICLK